MSFEIIKKEFINCMKKAFDKHSPRDPYAVQICLVKSGDRMQYSVYHNWEFSRMVEFEEIVILNIIYKMFMPKIKEVLVKCFDVLEQQVGSHAKVFVMKDDKSRDGIRMMLYKKVEDRFTYVQDITEDDILKFKNS